MRDGLAMFLLVVGGVIFGAVIGLLLHNTELSILASDWLFWAFVVATPLLWLAGFVFRRQRRHGRISLDKSP
jgi:hypothetical protein